MKDKEQSEEIVQETFIRLWINREKLDANHNKQTEAEKKFLIVLNISISKKKTGKTYLDLLTEIRISHACRMLAEENVSVESICYECGFNNVTNFFKSFKKLKNTTPSIYRRICSV